MVIKTKRGSIHFPIEALTASFWVWVYTNEISLAGIALFLFIPFWKRFGD